jgi:Mlc titration factor MtfA (ptsG expression regulator)
MNSLIFLQVINDAQSDTNKQVLEVMLFLAFLVFFLYSIRRFREHIAARNNEIKYRQNIIKALPDYLVYDGKNLPLSPNDIDQILLKRFPYYQSLDASLKQKFLRRVISFIKEKVFIIRHYEGYKEMPVLLSAAAIQITFGLQHYKLPFFKYIQIHPEEYFAQNSLRVLAGHVYGNTITVAWNHFLQGFSEHDGKNVGLHEMAHALYYQHIIADIVKHKPFVANFELVMAEGQETFDCNKDNRELFSDYAFKNLQEFWAESLELFFEKPFELQRCYPDLFTGLRSLLKQDPLQLSNPVLQ